MFEAAKLAPRQRHELALAYGKGRRGNGNRAPLAAAGKLSERGLAGMYKGPRLTVGLCLYGPGFSATCPLAWIPSPVQRVAAVQRAAEVQRVAPVQHFAQERRGIEAQFWPLVWPRSSAHFWPLAWTRSSA